MNNYELAMKQKKPVRVVALLLQEYLYEKAKVDKTKELEEQYDEMISQLIEDGYKLIVFDEYEEKINEETLENTKEPLLSDEQKEKLEQCDKCKVVPSKELYIKENFEEPISEPIDDFIDMLKEYALSLINSKFEEAMDDIRKKYPQLEMLSWDNQEREARAFVADNNASTPLLDQISAIRNIDKTELANRIIAKADAYKTLVGQAIGKRQLLEDMIGMAASVDELKGIKW